MNNVLVKFTMSLIMVFSLASCMETAKEEANAEDAAVGFFNALYNQKDINKAASFCTKDFAKLVKKHKTAHNVARRLFNMHYDNVKVDTGMGDATVRREFSSTGELTVLFTGQYDGRTIKELKKIKLIKQNEKWYVDKILKDPVPR